MREVEVLEGFPYVGPFQFVKGFFEVILSITLEFCPSIFPKVEMYSFTMIALSESSLL